MTPGDLYGFKLATDVSVEWLVVREMDGLYLLVPADDTPMVGTCDVRLPSARQPGQAEMIARCGLSTWAHPADLSRRGPVRFGAVDATDLGVVRVVLSRLARGVIPGGDGPDDDDPTYWHLCQELERLGIELNGGLIPSG